MGHSVLNPAVLHVVAKQALQPTTQQTLEKHGTDKQHPQLTDGKWEVRKPAEYLIVLLSSGTCIQCYLRPLLYLL